MIIFGREGFLILFASDPNTLIRKDPTLISNPTTWRKFALENIPIMSLGHHHRWKQSTPLPPKIIPKRTTIIKFINNSLNYNYIPRNWYARLWINLGTDSVAIGIATWARRDPRELRRLVGICSQGTPSAQYTRKYGKGRRPRAGHPRKYHCTRLQCIYLDVASSTHQRCLINIHSSECRRFFAHPRFSCTTVSHTAAEQKRYDLPMGIIVPPRVQVGRGGRQRSWGAQYSSFKQCRPPFPLLPYTLPFSSAVSTSSITQMLGGYLQEEARVGRWIFSGRTITARRQNKSVLSPYRSCIKPVQGQLCMPMSLIYFTLS